MKKKINLLTIALLLMGILTGCGNVQKEDTSLKNIESRGKIVLGTAADYAPYEWHIIDGKKDEIVGVDIEIAKKVAEDLGVKLEIKDMQFSGLFPALDAGDIDMVIAGMVVDEKRLEAADFTKPYFEQGQVLLVKQENADKYKSQGDLKGKKIGTQLGTTQQEYADKNFSSEVIAIPNNNDLVMELENGSLDAVFMSELTAKQFASVNKNLKVVEIKDMPTEGGSCIAVKKGNTALVNALNESVEKLTKTDQIQKWFVEYTKLADENK